MHMNACDNAPHTWILQGEVKGMVRIVFHPEASAAVTLSEDLERQVVEAYGKHLQRMSYWTPHEYIVSEQDICNTLAGRAAFI